MGINHYHIADFFESDDVAITLDNSYICEDAFIRRTELHDSDGWYPFIKIAYKKELELEAALEKEEAETKAEKIINAEVEA